MPKGVYVRSLKTLKHLRFLAAGQKGKPLRPSHRRKIKAWRATWPSSGMLGKNHSKKTREKQSVAMKRVLLNGDFRRHPTGKNHPFWKGGEKDPIRAARLSPANKRWRKAVYKRDKYTCQDCGDNRGGNLEAHHIKDFINYPALRFVLSNGLTLCKPCHKKTDNYGSRNRKKTMAKMKPMMKEKEMKKGKSVSKQIDRLIKNAGKARGLKY